MKIETTITERDKKLLVMLALFLIAVGFYFFILSPNLKAAQILNEEIAEATDNKLVMLDKLSLLSARENTLLSTQQQWEAVSSQIYDLMESQEIDSLVTSEVMAFGLDIKSIRITMNEEPVTLTGLGKSADESGDQIEESVSTIYSATAALTIEGSDDIIWELTDHLQADYSALRITSMKYETETGAADGEDALTTLNMTLVLYMCEK